MPPTLQQQVKCVQWFCISLAFNVNLDVFMVFVKHLPTGILKDGDNILRKKVRFWKKHGGGRRHNAVREEHIRHLLLASPTKSLKRLSLETATSYTTCQPFVREYLKMYAYHIQRVHVLNNQDYASRFKFTNWVCKQLEDDKNFFNPTENPHTYYKQQRASPQVNVWCAVTQYGTCAIFHCGANGHLEIVFVYALTVFIPQLHDTGNVIFLQDGVPPHWSIAVRNFLNEIFAERWCGRGGAIFWPPNSPDFTPPDFFVWSYVKNIIYVQHPIDRWLAKKNNPCILVYHTRNASTYVAINLCKI